MWQCSPHGQYDCELCVIEEIPELSYGNPAMSLDLNIDRDLGSSYMYDQFPVLSYSPYYSSQGPSTSDEPTQIQSNQVPINTVERQTSRIQSNQTTEDARLSTDPDRADEDTLLRNSETDNVEKGIVDVKKQAATSEQLRADDRSVLGEQSVSTKSQISKVIKKLDSVSIEAASKQNDETTKVANHFEATAEINSHSENSVEENLIVSSVDGNNTFVQQFTQSEEQTESEILEDNAAGNIGDGTNSPQISTEESGSSEKSPVNLEVATSDNSSIQTLDKNQEILNSISAEQLLVEENNYEAQTIGTSVNRPSDTQPTQASSVGEYQLTEEMKSSPTLCIKEKHSRDSGYVTKPGSPELETTSGMMEQIIPSPAQASSLGEYHETDDLATKSSPIKEAGTAGHIEASDILSNEVEKELNSELVSSSGNPETGGKLDMMKQETQTTTQPSSIEQYPEIDAYEKKNSPMNVAKAVDNSIEASQITAIQESNGSNSQLGSKLGSKGSETIYEMMSRKVSPSPQIPSIDQCQGTDAFKMKNSPMTVAEAVDSSNEASQSMANQKSNGLNSELLAKSGSPKPEATFEMMKQATPILTRASLIEEFQGTDDFEAKSTPINGTEAVSKTIDASHNLSIKKKDGSNSEFVSKLGSTESETIYEMMSQKVSTPPAASAIGGYHKTDDVETKSSPIKEADIVDPIKVSHVLDTKEKNNLNSEPVSKPGTTESEESHEMISRKVSTLPETSPLEKYHKTDDFETQTSPIKEADTVDLIETSDVLATKEEEGLNSELVTKPESPDTEETFGTMNQESPIPKRTSPNDHYTVTNAFKTKNSSMKVGETVDSTIEASHNVAIQENNSLNSELDSKPVSTESEAIHEMMSQKVSTPTDTSALGHNLKTDDVETKNSPMNVAEVVDRFIDSSYNLSIKKKDGLNSDLVTKAGNPEIVAASGMMKQEVATSTEASALGEYHKTDDVETNSTPIKEAETADGSIEPSHNLSINKNNGLNSTVASNPGNPEIGATSGMEKEEMSTPTAEKSVKKKMLHIPEEDTDIARALRMSEKKTDANSMKSCANPIPEEPSHNPAIQENDGLNSELVTRPRSPETEATFGMMNQEISIPTQVSPNDPSQVTDVLKTKKGSVRVAEAVESSNEATHEPSIQENNGLNSELVSRPGSPEIGATSVMAKQELPTPIQTSPIEQRMTNTFETKNSPIKEVEVVDDSITSHNLANQEKNYLNSGLVIKTGNEEIGTSAMMKEGLPTPPAEKPIKKKMLRSPKEDTDSAPVRMSEKKADINSKKSCANPLPEKASHNLPIQENDGLNSELLTEPGSPKTITTSGMVNQAAPTASQTSSIEQFSMTDAFQTKNSPIKDKEVYDNSIASHSLANQEKNYLNSGLVIKTGNEEIGTSAMMKKVLPTPPAEKPIKKKMLRSPKEDTDNARVLRKSERQADKNSKKSCANPVPEEATHNPAIQGNDELNSETVSKPRSPKIGATSGLVKQKIPIPTESSLTGASQVTNSVETTSNPINIADTVNSTEDSHHLSIRKKRGLNSKLATKPAVPETEATTSAMKKQEIPTPPAEKSVEKKDARVLKKSEKKADKTPKKSRANPVPEEHASLGCSSSSPVDSARVAAFSSDSDHDNSDTTTSKQVIGQVSSAQDSQRNDGELNKTTSSVQDRSRVTRNNARVNRDAEMRRAGKRQNSSLESQRPKKDKTNVGDGEIDTRVNDIGNGLAQILQMSDENLLYKNIKRFTNLSRDDFNSCIEWIKSNPGEPKRSFKRKNTITLLFKERHGKRSVEDYKELASILSPVIVNHPSQCEIEECSPKFTQDVECATHKRDYMACQDYENRLWPVSTFSDFKCSKSVQDADIEEKKMIHFSTIILNTLKNTSSKEMKTRIAKTLLGLCICLAKRKFFALSNIEDRIKTAVTISDSVYRKEFSTEPFRMLNKGVYTLENDSCLPWLQWFFRFSTESLQQPRFEYWENDWKSIIEKNMSLRGSELYAELLRSKAELEEKDEWNEDARKLFEERKKAIGLALLKLDGLKAEDFKGYFDTEPRNQVTSDNGTSESTDVAKKNAGRTPRSVQRKNAELPSTSARMESVEPEEPDQSPSLEETKRPAKRRDAETSVSATRTKQRKVSVPDEVPDMQLSEEPVLQPQSSGAKSARNRN